MQFGPFFIPADKRLRSESMLDKRKVAAPADSPRSMPIEASAQQDNNKTPQPTIEDFVAAAREAGGF